MIRRLFAVVLLCAAFASSHARAEQDAVQFFSNIDVPAGSTIHDAVCLFCSVKLDGRATGDVVVLFGNTHIANDAEHDVVNLFGRITADDHATIHHDLVSVFGGVRLGENVHVGNDLVAVFGAVHSGDGVTVEGDRVVQPPFVFWVPFLLFVGVVILIVRGVRAARRRAWLAAYGYPPRP